MPEVDVRKVDITTTGIRRVLMVLAETVASDPSEKQLLVKVYAPVHIHVVPSPVAASTTNAGPSLSMLTTSDIVENFMSTWTRLVGDPILSKWIIMMLAVSVSLNGYLLKGIAAGLAGKGLAGKESVRFAGTLPLDEMKSSREPVEPEATPIVRPKPIKPAIPVIVAPTAIAPIPRRIPKFSLETLNERLRTQNLALRVPSSSETSTTSSSPDGPQSPDLSTEPVRSLEECIDIFENGPRPVSLSLSMLTDEEVILLAQNGKVALHALEKVLDGGAKDNNKLERAVRIRRALFCEFLL